MAVIFGGTFDPIHCGHLRIANAAAEACSEKVMMLLSARPGHRNKPYASVEHRWEMLELACADEPLLEPSDIEVSRIGRSFAVDTLVELGATSAQPGIWVIGADAVGLASSWHRYEHLRRICSFLALRRPDSPRQTIPPGFESVRNVQSVRESGGRICWLSNAMSSVSATQVRECVALGGNLDKLVPRNVWSYIQCRDLYRTIHRQV